MTDNEKRAYLILCGWTNQWLYWHKNNEFVYCTFEEALHAELTGLFPIATDIEIL
jgi:hypothetical protein